LNIEHRTLNILFLTQVLPYPLDAGPKVRAYHMLRHLSQQHQVTLVSFVRPDDRPEYVAHLRDIAAAVHTVPIRRSPGRNVCAALKGLLTSLPVAIVRDDMPEMTALLRRLTAETRFDVIHADQLSMAGWGQIAARFAAKLPCHPVTLSPCHPVTLLDEHNAIYHLTERMADEARGLRRLLMRREAAAFRRYEAVMLRAYDAVLTVTEEDRALLLALQGEMCAVRCTMLDVHFTSNIVHPTSNITVIPICVDPEASKPVDRETRRQGNNEAPLSTCLPASLSTCLPASLSTCLPASLSTPVILHLGTMFWPPNVAGVLWFVREALPLVWREIPEARFVIVGKNPPAEVQALAADSRIVVTGYVADPLPYLEAADVSVVPLFSGGGMRVKILDAWLRGLPIVSTPLGAEGIEVRDGENILLAADAPTFAAAVLRLLTDRDLNTHLRAAGRAWVEQTYSWQTVYRQVDQVYAQLLAAQPTAHCQLTTDH
jgi:glycosyltransferase involved in cell wall biosynthesis